MGDVHRQHRRCIPVGLLHHPVARAATRVELSAPLARNRCLRWPDHLFDDARRDCQDARAPSLRPCRRLYRHEYRRRTDHPLPRHRTGATRPDPRMTVALWAGVVVIGGVGAVLRFLVDRTVSGWIPGSFPYGTLVVN